MKGRERGERGRGMKGKGRGETRGKGGEGWGCVSSGHCIVVNKTDDTVGGGGRGGREI